MPGGLNFDFTFGGAPRATRREPDSPLRILVLGSFSGRSQPGDDLARRPVRRIDLDAFAAALRQCAPTVAFAAQAGQPTVQVSLESLDHFHPDELYARLPLFQAIRETRARLQNPSTFAAAAAELRQHATVPALTGGELAQAPADGDADTINRLLGKSTGSTLSAPGGSAQRPDLQSLIRSIVAPHIIANEMPFQQQYLAAIDDAAGDLMRELLHAPAFQLLEANWRGIRQLVDALELDDTVRLDVVDVTQDELRADLGRGGRDLTESGLHRLLASRAQAAPEPQPWSLLVGLYSFGSNDADVGMLAAIGAIAAQNGSPFLAAADASTVGCPSLVDAPEPGTWKTDADADKAWNALRSSAAARWLGLAMPRVLMRLPYGKSTDPTDRFAFEELKDARTHEHLLWGSPALACVLLLGRSFMEEGWDMEPGGQLEVDDLPAYTRNEDGESRLQACAEAFLSERAAQAILDRGVMPFLSFRNRSAIRVMRLQSLASPPAPLAGAWRSG
jgi:type VI secretion system ImpC/EvpB family protein